MDRRGSFPLRFRSHRSYKTVFPLRRQGDIQSIRFRSRCLVYSLPSAVQSHKGSYENYAHLLWAEATANATARTTATNRNRNRKGSLAWLSFTW